MSVPEEYVTQAGALVEIDGDGERVTQAGALVEIDGGGERVTQTGALVEVRGNAEYVTQAGALVEILYVEPDIMPTYFARAAGRREIHNIIPEPVTGYAFDPDHSWWSAIVAQAGENLIHNASFENGSLTSFPSDASTGVGWLDTVTKFGSFGATHGRYSTEHRINDPGNYFFMADNLPVSPGVYSLSFDIYAVTIPLNFYLFIYDQSGTINSDNPFSSHAWIAANKIHVDRSGWHRVHLTYSELGTGLRRAGLWCETTGETIFWTDAWQFEAGEPTTFIYGDMVGFNDRQPSESYYFTGTQHISSSIRRARTGSGGKPISFSEDTGFATTGIVGLGMSPVEQITYNTARGNEIHRTIRDMPNDFTITGVICGSTYNELNRNHAALVRLLRPNNTVNRDQMILRHQALDSQGMATGFPVDIICVYRDGLRGNINNLYQEQIALQFHSVQPHVVETIDSSANLNVNKKLYQNGIFYIDSDGEYHNLGTGGTIGVPSAISQVGFLSDGTIVAGGNFSQICGDVVSDRAYWDGSNWQLWGGDLSPKGITQVRDIDTGSVYGYSPVMAANGGQLLELAVASWQILDEPLNNSILDIVRDVEGRVWVAGVFDDTDAATLPWGNHVAYYDPDTGQLTALGHGLNSYAETILPTNDGYVWIGGNFTIAENGDGTSVVSRRVARYSIDDDTYDVDVGAGLNGIVKKLIRGDDGFIYAVGDFTMNGNNTRDIRGFARWNGFIWEEVFPLTHVDGTYGADGVMQDRNGIFWFHGIQTSGATVSGDWFDVSQTIGPCTVFGWRDGVFYPPFATDTGGIEDWEIRDGNEMVIAYKDYDNTGVSVPQDVVVPALNRIDYDGDADSPVSIHISGPADPIQIIHDNREVGIYFQPTLTIGDNETMVARNDMQRAVVYSNSRPTLARHINAGPSNLRDITLTPGENRISVLCVNADTADAWLTWRNRYYGISQTLV